MADFDLMGWLQETGIDTVGVFAIAYLVGMVGDAMNMTAWLINPIKDFSVPVLIGLFVALGVANFALRKLNFKK